MTERNVVKQIRGLLRQRKAILLAHNYMRDEIQEIANITGDSLGLSIEAARTDAAEVRRKAKAALDRMLAVPRD